MKTVTITNLSRPELKSFSAGYCDSFLCQLRGLMFRKSIDIGVGLLLVNKKEDRVSSTIHMMNMRFDICVVWINKAGEVVDVRYARRGRLAYTPQAPACYVLELNTAHINNFNIGDRVQIDDAPSTT